MIIRLSQSTIFILFLSLCAMIALGYLFAEFTYAQQDEYYEDYGEEPQLPQNEGYVEEPGIPEYKEPGEQGDSYIEQPQNPDPEFMEEIEPGEYNQSDDTTELNDHY